MRAPIRRQPAFVIYEEPISSDELHRNASVHHPSASSSERASYRSPTPAHRSPIVYDKVAVRQPPITPLLQRLCSSSVRVLRLYPSQTRPRRHPAQHAAPRLEIRRVFKAHRSDEDAYLKIRRRNSLTTKTTLDQVSKSSSLISIM